MSVKKLQKILDEIDYPVMVEIVDCLWANMDGSIYWNTDNNKTALEYVVGETFSLEVLNNETIYDGYLVVNGDTGCGETVTYFFNLSKEVKF